MKEMKKVTMKQLWGLPRKMNKKEGDETHVYRENGDYEDDDEHEGLPWI